MLKGTVNYEPRRRRYRAYIRDKEGNSLIKRFFTEEEAWDWLKEINLAMATGTYCPPNKFTLGEWLIYWLTTFKKDLRPKTKLQYLNSFNYLAPILERDLQKLSAIELQNCINSLPSGLSYSSRKKVYQLAASAIKKAFNLSIINKNIMLAVEMPKGGKPKKKIEIFTLEEIRQIFHYLEHDCNDPTLVRLYPLFLLLATSGMRVGEVLGTLVGDVDFKANKIHVCRSLQYIPGAGSILQEPKTAAGDRIITLPGEVVRNLASMVGKKSTKDYLFTTNAGTPFLLANLSKFWRRILAGAGIEYKNIHVLRHSHATNLLANGVPLLEVSKRLGHAKASHTLDLYGHAVPKADLGIADTVADMYLKDK